MLTIAKGDIIMVTQLSQERINNIKEFLIDKFSPVFIVIFGSAAKGMLREDSDVDIAFLSDESYSEYEVFNISQELGAILGRDIDLIDIKKASTVFKVQILGNGKIIYSKDDIKTKTFHMEAYREYCMLNEDRKEILDKVRERGAIYYE